MEDLHKNCFTQLDARYSSDSIFLLKALACIMPQETQYQIVLITKILELGQLLQNNSCILPPCDEPPSILDVLNDLQQCCSLEKMSTLQQIRDYVQIFQTIKQFRELMEVLRETGAFEGGFGASEEGDCKKENSDKFSVDPELLKSILPPEQQNMADLFSVFMNELQ
ncbi:MAG: hypothetical protein ACI4DU_04500 [Lachnospiraceae bacterium]